jgi:hypothetical protein
VLCDEQSIGGDGEYCDDNHAQLNRINAIYHEASGGKTCHVRCSSTSSPA